MSASIHSYLLGDSLQYPDNDPANHTRQAAGNSAVVVKLDAEEYSNIKRNAKSPRETEFCREYHSHQARVRLTVNQQFKAVPTQWEA